MLFRSADVQDCYWLDLGTPKSFIKGACDLISEKFNSPIFDSHNFEFWAEASSQINPTALIRGASAIGRNCLVGANNQITSSVFFNQVQTDSEVMVEDSILAEGVKIEAGASIKDSVVGAGAVIEAGATLNNCRVWPLMKISGEFHNMDYTSQK